MPTTATTTTTCQRIASTETYNKPSDVSKTSPKQHSRSPSVERIKKINTYICAQNYYFLPAIITWLRAPHDKLQVKLERVIAISKYVLFSTFFPRLAFKLVIAASLVAYNYISIERQPIFSQLRTALENVEVIRFSVYAGLTMVSLQFMVCLYYLFGVMQVGGYIFLCTCLYLLTQLNVRCMLFYPKESSTVIKIAGKTIQGQKRLSRRDILGKRTISNMNLI